MADGVKIGQTVLINSESMEVNGVFGVVLRVDDANVTFPYCVRHYRRSVDAYVDEWFRSDEVTPIESTGHSDIDGPSHYTFGSNGAQVLDITEHLNFCRGNVVKYVCRAGRKDPERELEDLKKARVYLDREIARMENSGSGLVDPWAPGTDVTHRLSNVPEGLILIDRDGDLARSCGDGYFDRLYLSESDTRWMPGQSDASIVAAYAPIKVATQAQIPSVEEDDD